jgi:lipopolysaccharide assembly outer membrane protein LptD (OstA)
MMKKSLVFLMLFMIAYLVAADGNGGVVSSNDSELFATDPSVLADSLKVDLETPVRIDSLFYQADSIRAYYEEEQIWLYGNTVIDYGSSRIMADSLFLDIKREQATSMGRTRMQDGDQLLKTVTTVEKKSVKLVPVLTISMVVALPPVIWNPLAIGFGRGICVSIKETR